MSTRVRLLYGSERYGYFTGAYAHSQVHRDALLKGIVEAQLAMGPITRTAYTVKLYKILLQQKATAGKKLVVWRVPRRVRNCEYRVKLRQHFAGRGPGKPKAKVNPWKAVAKAPRPNIHRPDVPEPAEVGGPGIDGWQAAVKQARANAQANADRIMGGRPRP